MLTASYICTNPWQFRPEFLDNAEWSSSCVGIDPIDAPNVIPGGGTRSFKSTIGDYCLAIPVGIVRD